VKVGLVLGGGGVMGGAWITGALEAFARETGWFPGSADYVVGTSAGAMMGSLVACGVPAWFMVAHSAGEVFDGLLDSRGQPVSGADRSAGAVFRLERGWPRLGPSSLRLAMGGRSLAARLAGLGPEGWISTAPLKEIVRRAVPSGWAPHANLWITACDYDSGERVVFGRKGSPRADLADAVAASCAIPSFYRPVRIDGRRYVDGGLHSASNLDLLSGLSLDLVICLNPLSTLRRDPGPFLHVRVWDWIRRGAVRSVRREAAALRREGVPVLLLEPTARDLDVMGLNFMSRRRRHDVIRTAIDTVARQLHRARAQELLAKLPRSPQAKVRRPAGAPSTWDAQVLRA
jgi:NTE family protein